MDYHEYTLARYMEEVDREERLNDAIEKVLVEIDEKYPNCLPENEEECFKIGYDIVTNEYNIDTYVEEYLNTEEN